MIDIRGYLMCRCWFILLFCFRYKYSYGAAVIADLKTKHFLKKSPRFIGGLVNCRFYQVFSLMLIKQCGNNQGRLVIFLTLLKTLQCSKYSATLSCLVQCFFRRLIYNADHHISCCWQYLNPFV